eukprot:8050324-Pyramimonas_sp.AAC.1
MPVVHWCRHACEILCCALLPVCRRRFLDLEDPEQCGNLCPLARWSHLCHAGLQHGAVNAVVGCLPCRG